MTKHKRTDPPERFCIHMPKSLVAKIRILMADPVSGKIPYGVPSKIGERLWRNWIREQQMKYRRPFKPISHHDEEELE